jgi:hypothetical protein
MADSSTSRLLEALAALARGLESIEAPSMIIGGIAVIAHGVSRQTIDLDATVLADRVEPDALLRALAEVSICPRIENALEFAARSQVLLLVHEPTGITLEISFAFTSFEREALARARMVDFGGVRIAVAEPEDLLIYKVLAWRDRDRYDIQELLNLHGEQIDLGRVRAFVREFASILEAPERVEEFERLISAR